MNGFDNGPYGQNYTTGGGGGGGGGGGFMSNSQGSPGGDGTKRSGSNTLRPVTIRQINNVQQAHTDAELILDGQELNQLTFVGMIRNIAKHPTNFQYNIEDGTGTVDVRKWLDNQSEDPAEEEGLEVNKYVRVTGSLKTLNQRRALQASLIRPITDYNEIFFHKLEAAYVHLQLTRGGGAGGDGDDAKAYQNGGDVTMANVGNAQVEDPFQRKVLQIIEGMAAANDGEGVSIDAITRRLSSVPKEKIRAACNALTEEGYVYIAEDDDHFMPTTT